MEQILLYTGVKINYWGNAVHQSYRVIGGIQYTHTNKKGNTNIVTKYKHFTK